MPHKSCVDNLIQTRILRLNDLQLTLANYHASENDYFPNDSVNWRLVALAVQFQSNDICATAVGGSRVFYFGKYRLHGKLKELLPLEKCAGVPPEMQTRLPAVAEQLFLDIRKAHEETSQSKNKKGKPRSV